MTQETKIVIFACSTMTIVVLLLGAGIAIIQNGALMKMGIRQFMAIDDAIEAAVALCAARTASAGKGAE